MKEGRHQDRMEEGVTVINVPKTRWAFIFLESMRSVVSTSEFLGPTQLKIGDSLHLGSVFSACRRCISEESSTPIHARFPVATWAATRPRVSAATNPKAKLHSKGPSTSPCSAPRSLGIRRKPSSCTWDKFRCFHPAVTVCLGRKWAEVPRCCHEGCNYSFAERKESS